jgi:hypothetical protein
MSNTGSDRRDGPTVQSLSETTALVLAFVIGLSLSLLISQDKREDAAVHQVRVSKIDVLGVGVILGGVVAGPMVLSVRRIFTRRWMAWSLGELLWLAPAVLYGTARGISFLLATIWQATPLVYLAYIAIQSLCSVSAFIVMCWYLSGGSARRNWQWTDVLGCMSSLAYGGLLIYWETAYPLTI